jgi:hypothetical protein
VNLPGVLKEVLSNEIKQINSGGESVDYNKNSKKLSEEI